MTTSSFIGRSHPFCLSLASLSIFAGLAAGAVMGAFEPEPRVVSPGKLVDPAPLPPPSDAIVLFDGTTLDAWQTDAGKPASWTVEGKPGGAMTIAAGKGGIFSRQKFRDVQLHVEFATPAEVRGDGQERGNSGVYLQGRFEVQVLDSFNNPTYPNGQCGAIYGHHIPLVNASRATGEWQTYDIVFHAPRFDPAGAKVAEARMTVLHNGVLIHDNVNVPAPTTAAPGAESSTEGPLYLQDHGNPVRYRNIWIRPL